MNPVGPGPEGSVRGGSKVDVVGGTVETLGGVVCSRVGNGKARPNNEVEGPQVDECTGLEVGKTVLN